MPVHNDDKVDFLWKKVIYGVAETASETLAAGGKQAPEEAIVSPTVVFKDGYWSETDLIPRPAAGASDSVVEYHTAVRCVSDPTLSQVRTWIAVADVAVDPYTTPANRLGDWVPPTIHPSYRIRVYAGDPLGGGQNLNPLVPDQEWVFDYVSGVVYFPNAIPTRVATDGVWIVGYRYIGAKGVAGGVGSTLQDPGDGSFDDGAVKGWEIGSTTVSKAIDDLNEILAKLLPSQPAALSTKTLAMTGGYDARGGDHVLLASGVADNSGGGAPAAGQRIYRIANGTATSAAVTGFGSGNSGTLTALVNGTAAGAKALTAGSDTGTTGSLVISRDADYPAATPGFWQELDAAVSAAVPVGVNAFRLNHSETGQTNAVHFVRDDLTTAPDVSGLNVIEGASNTQAMSSGIPHYIAGVTLAVSGTVDKLAGKTFLAGGLIQISTTPSVGGTVAVNPGQGGLPAVLPSDMPPHNFAGQTYTISGPAHTTTRVQVRGRNPHGDGTLVNFSKQINVMAGSPTGPVIEMAVPVVNMGSTPNGDNAGRVTMGNGDTPADNVTALTAPNWNSSANLQGWDAAVRGGVLRHDVTNYNDGTWMPVGPDLSAGRSGVQYATFMFRRSAISQFSIEIQGSYAGCWVKLPGLPGLVGSLGGWWSMYQLYGGAGVPDTAGNPSPGCAVGTAMNGTSGTFRCTFGTASSTNAANNIILVRLRLSPGQAVSGLRFIGV